MGTNRHPPGGSELFIELAYLHKLGHRSAWPRDAERCADLSRSETARANLAGLTPSRYCCVMRPLRYSINVTLDGCCDHRAIIPDEDLHRHAVENLKQADALLFGRV